MPVLAWTIVDRLSETRLLDNKEIQMVTNEQVRNLMKLIQKEKTLLIAAAKAGMDEKTAHNYRRAGKLPRPSGRNGLNLVPTAHENPSEL